MHNSVEDNISHINIQFIIRPWPTQCNARFYAVEYKASLSFTDSMHCGGSPIALFLSLCILLDAL